MGKTLTRLETSILLEKMLSVLGTVDKFRVRGAEKPAQTLPNVITVDLDGLNAEDPTRMQANGKVKGTGPREGTAQHDT